MDIGRLVANIGVDRTAAQSAVGITKQFLITADSAARAQSCIDQAYGVNRTIKAAQPQFNSLVKAGKHAVGDIAGAIPGLRQYI